MKIALPTRNNAVDGHFGHCEYYTIFEVSDDKKILDSKFMASPEGCGCKSDIGPLLQNMGVTLMLAGNMGEGALNVLNSHGMEVVRGCSGNVNKVIEDYLAGTIADSGVGCKEHEAHHGDGGDGHSCGH